MINLLLTMPRALRDFEGVPHGHVDLSKDYGASLNLYKCCLVTQRLANSHQAVALVKQASPPDWWPDRRTSTVLSCSTLMSLESELRLCTTL